MTPIEEFEKLWRESEEPLLTLKQNSLYFYLAATKRTAQECVEICGGLTVNRPDDPFANYFDGGMRAAAQAITERFLK